MPNGFHSPAFIVGIGRSGTTLLAAILNRHPEVFVTPETAFFRLVLDYPSGVDGFIRDWPGSLRQIATFMRATSIFDPPSLAEEAIQNIGPKISSVSRAFVGFCEVLSKPSGKSYWIEKTPVHIAHIALIRRLFPRAPIIHLVRDGRAVAESRSRMDYLEGEGRDYYNNLLAWAQWTQIAHADLADDPFGYELRYESLTSQPRDAVMNVCRFLGIEYNDEMLEPDGSDRGLVEGWATHKEGIFVPIDSTKAAAWQATLSPSSMTISDILVGDTLDRLGYGNQAKSIARKTHVAITTDFFDNSIRPIILSLLQQLPQTVKSVRFSGFVTWVEGAREEQTVDTLPRLIVRPRGLLNEASVVDEEIVIVGSPPIDSAKGLPRLLLELLILWHKLRWIRDRGAKLIWIYDGNFDLTARWRLRRLMENRLAQSASVIVCTCGDRNSCRVQELLRARATSVVHLQHDKLPNAFS